MTIHNFWLNKSKLIEWYKNPTTAFKKREIIFTWYPNGKINIYHNCNKEYKVKSW